MKKETQFLYVVLLCGLTLLASGCGIMPSKLISPAQAEKERQDELEGTTTKKSENTVDPQFPAIYPKPAR